MDPAVAPGAILMGQPADDRNSPGRDAGPPRAVALSPPAADQVPVPAEQRLGLQEEPTSTSSVHESTQSGDKCSIGWTEHRSSDLPTKDCNLVAEHDDLDGQIVAVAVTQMDQLEDLDEGEVEERQGHGPVSTSPMNRERPLNNSPRSSGWGCPFSTACRLVRPGSRVPRCVGVGSSAGQPTTVD